jgi:hypothetical protein
MFGLIEPLSSEGLPRRARRTWTRWFAQTGLLRGAANEAVSALRSPVATAARRRAARRLVLDPDEARLLAELRRDRILGIEIEDASLRADVLAYAAELQELVREITIDDLRELQGGHNYFFRNIYEGAPGDPFRQLALSPRIVRLAAAYLGELPILQDVEYNYSPAHVPLEGEWSGSQLWHVDHDQARRLKVFVNTHDMTYEHGPTLVLDRSRSILRLRPNFPGCFDDDEARAVGIDPVAHRALLGPAGTMHLVDTSRLVHCGSRAVHTRRFLLVLTYGPSRSRLSPSNDRRCLGGAHLAEENRKLWRCIENRGTA